MNEKVICPLCKKEFNNNRQLHGHLMKAHTEEYRAVGFQKEKLVAVEKCQDKKKKKPEGFRVLNTRDADEKFAFENGSDFIDAQDILYTFEEAKEFGWA